jgi:hypothetical protein
MIGISGVLYTQSLSKHSAVYIEMVDGEWQAWRETYQNGRKKAVSVKIIAKGTTFEYVLLKARGYFDYIERKRSG